LFLFAACQKGSIDDISQKPHQDNPLFGYWVLADNGYSGKQMHFVKKDEFDENKFGYRFYNEDSVVIRLKIACGDPPKFDNIPGHYHISDDSILNINYFYGRENSYNKIIKYLSGDSLVLINY